MTVQEFLAPFIKGIGTGRITITQPRPKVNQCEQCFGEGHVVQMSLIDQRWICEKDRSHQADNPPSPAMGGWG